MTGVEAGPRVGAKIETGAEAGAGAGTGTGAVDGTTTFVWSFLKDAKMGSSSVSSAAGAVTGFLAFNASIVAGLVLETAVEAGASKERTLTPEGERVGVEQKKRENEGNLVLYPMLTLKSKMKS